MTDQPNILLIMSDQHNKHVIGCYGDEVVSTPNMDRLSQEGVLFESAYCAYPLCVPSRMSFMTGRYPHRLGIWENRDILPSRIPTFAHSLGRTGYEVVLCGRMDFHGPDQRHGFQARIFPEVSEASLNELQGTQAFHRVSIEKSGPGTNPYLLYDAACAERAKEWLLKRPSEGTRPFCLVVGFTGPHCPFVCPRDLFEHYRASVPPPLAANLGALETLHPYHQAFRTSSGLFDLTEDEIRRTRAAYYGMVEYDDRLIGQILKALTMSRLAHDTCVVYTSDHGEMAGEHGLWWKMSLYEGSVGVPLIISWPERFPSGRRVKTPVSLIDVGPTLADLACADPIPGTDGGTLVPLLSGSLEQPDRAAFSELFAISWVDEGHSGPTGGPARMLRRDDWKYWCYHGKVSELFHLSQDPEERTNRAGDPACKEIMESMKAEVLAGWDPEAIRQQATARKTEMQYISAAPEDPETYEGEIWSCPTDCGKLDPVAP